MKKRKINPYLTAAAVLALSAITLLSVLLFITRQNEKYYRLQAKNNSRHAFTELVTATGELDAALQKCVLSGSASMQSRNFTEVYAASKAAKQALSGIPRREGEFEQTSGFITQVGDYAFALSKKTVSGGRLDETDAENLKKLAETAQVLSGNLTAMLGDINSGGLTLEDLRELEKRAARAGDDAVADSFNSRVKATEQEFPEMPELIYDGPFSSHLSAQKPKMTGGQQDVSAQEAQKRAEEFFGVESLSLDGERGGNLPIYMFSAPSDGDGSVNIEVTKQGGFIVNLYSSHVPAAESVSIEDAVKKAEEFVAEKITDPLTKSYHIAQGGGVTVNFAYCQDGVICYPDLIKVEVSRETGKVSGFEAQGYIMHHTRRDIPEPRVSEQQARETVSKDLKILSHAPAIIPTGGGNEVFCHEFVCENGEGAHNIVYINAETGAEEQILILIENENGTLAR